MYKTGTIAVTNGSAIVTGSGTLWVDAGVLNTGDLMFCPDGTLQEVLSFQSNTQLTLAGDGHGNTVYLGATLAGQAYGIVPIGLLPSSLALQVKTTLTAAQTAIGSAVLSTAAQGLTTIQQTNARTNISALGASDVGKGLLSKSVAGGVTVTLTAAEAANQFVELTGALTANINLVVPAAARLFVIRNSTTGAYTVTVKTAAGTGVTALQGGRMFIECDGTNCVDAMSFMRQTGGSVDGTPIGGTTPAAVAATTLSASGGAVIKGGADILVSNFLSGAAVGALVTLQRNDAKKAAIGLDASDNLVFLSASNVVQATLDDAGNLGLGVVPSGWYASGVKGLQIGPKASIASIASGSYTAVSNNWYSNITGSDTYIGTAEATTYRQTGGAHQWHTAPSGTAGAAITFTQAMTLDAGGNLLLNVPTYGSSNSYSIMLSGPNGVAYVQHAAGAVSGSSYSTFNYNGGAIGSITQNGTTAVAYNTTSDHRLKENVRPSNAARFMDIEFVDFEWIDGRHDCGVIAGQLQTVYPDLVLGAVDATEVRTVEIEPAIHAVTEQVLVSPAVDAIVEVVDADGVVTQEAVAAVAAVYETVEIIPAVPAVTEDQTFPVYQQVNYIGLIGRMGTRVQQLQRTVDAQAALIESLATRLTTWEAK